MEGDWGGEVGSQYEVIRNGDHMLTHFECDICHLCNIKGRSMEVSNLDYKIVPETIRRALLDSFWNWKPRTIRGNM